MVGRSFSDPMRGRISWNQDTFFPPKGGKGSALLVVLWVIALLSMLIITSMMVAMQDVETVTSRRMVFEARLLAEAGLAVGVHPSIKAGDPLLRKKVSSVESYEVNITTEESRLNIDALLTEDKRPVLERVFQAWGLAPVDAEMVVDCLMDWVDEDDMKRLKGAEKEDYARLGFKDRPYNRPFQSLDEVALVKGMDLVAEAQPRWREAFTLWGAGLLDINEAPAELIALVAGIPVTQARTLISTRNGPDGIPHTKDDQPIQSLDEAMVLLGVPPQGPPAAPTQGVPGQGGQAQGWAGLFTLHGNVQRVDSVGRVGTYARRISVIVQKNGVGGGQSPILEWREASE
jgi:type II secretory pathway component PulK